MYAVMEFYIAWNVGFLHTFLKNLSVQDGAFRLSRNVGKKLTIQSV